MVEIVIMLAIIMMVSLVVLVNFPAVTETIFIQRSGQEISGFLRRAQSMSLAVRNVRDPQSGVARSPCGVGIHAVNGGATMTLFGDLPNNVVIGCGSSDRLFQPAIDARIATYTLERNLKTNLSAATIGPQASVPELNIVFASPDAAITIFGNSRAVDYSRAFITVVTPKLSLHRVVEIAITGQISVK